MTEHAPSPEHHKHHEKLVDDEQQEAIERVVREKAEQAQAERSAENLRLLHELAAKEAETNRKNPLEDLKDKEPDNFAGMQQALKTTAYERTLLNVQQRLPKPARVFSKIAHNKTVETISNVGAKTVARPSGLLGGSTLAFVGSLVLLYYSKHYGFTYNYAFFFMLFVGGFAVGAIIELAIWALYKSRHGKY